MNNNSKRYTIEKYFSFLLIPVVTTIFWVGTLSSEVSSSSITLDKHEDIFSQIHITLGEIKVTLAEMQKDIEYLRQHAEEDK